MIQVSVIIVNYNTCNLTLNCIKSIKSNTQSLAYEIIVVDNDSYDESKKILKNDKSIIFIEAGDNLGFGSANNIGAKKAKGKYLFFLNSDTILLNNALKNFYDFYESHVNLNIGFLGSWLLDDTLNNNTSYSNITPSVSGTIYNSISFINRHLLKHKQTVKRTGKELFTNVKYVSGADLFIQKKLYDRVGGFDEDYFMYGEEVELEWRTMKMGYNNYIIKGPQIIHLEGGSSKKNKRVSFFQFYSMNRGKILFYKKHKSTPYCLLAFMVEGIIDLLFTSIDKRFKGKGRFYMSLYKMLLPGIKITPQIKKTAYYK